MDYSYILALHLIAVIAWMVGLLYLPRLFVYHSEVNQNSITYELFLLMEKRLIKIIMLPAMVLTTIFGSLLVYYNYDLVYEKYFQLKIILLIILFGYHGYLIKMSKLFVEKKITRSANFFRKINEVPTVLMIIIIILVVVKPDL